MRSVLLFGALSLLALIGGPVASADAAETSQITSPASPAYALNDESVSSPPPAFTVSATTNISGKIALRCYYGTEANSYNTFVKEVEPSGDSFSAPVEPKVLRDGPCVLRAVPFGNNEAHPPGTPSEESGDPFKGPRIVGSRFELYPENSNHYDYEIEPSSLSGFFEIESVGDCGLDYSYLYAPETLTESSPLFDCNAFIYPYDFPSSGEASRSELQIDGANAYSPDAAHSVEDELKVKLAGAPQVAVTKAFEAATGLVTVHEVDPIVKCSPEAVYPPTTTTCKEFVSAGVQLERTWQTTNGNQVAWMTDTWRSTDGVAHSLNALYGQDLNSEDKGAFKFPGATTFSPTANKQSVAISPGAGSIYYKEDAETPVTGDGKHPQGAIVYDTAPGGPVGFNQGSKENNFSRFEMPYQATIPAGGTYTLRMAFIQAYALSEVETLAQEVLASYHPTVTIGKPTNGETVSTSNVTVSGTASDSEGSPTLTVDGNAVSVATNGAWSTSVTLNKGANTITAVATNQIGLTAEKSVSVTYTPPSPPVAHASQVGTAKGKNGEVTFSLTCQGTAGTACEIEATLTTIEKTRHGKLVAVSARRHPRTRTEEVTVGSSKLTIPAGQKVTISIQLDSAGKSLLAKFGALPVHLSVAQVGSGHRSAVIAQNLTVTPHRKPRRHHHHHHR